MGSEVARIRALIDLEIQAANRVFTEASIVARHQVINAKNEIIAQYHQQLIPHVGEKAATEIVIEALSMLEKK